MVMTQAFTIRPMTQDDLKTAIGWAAAEGWNPGIEDATSFYAIDPTGFFMGWLDDQPIASVSAVDWGSGFGFLGLYMVAPEFRSHGYGQEMCRVALDHLEGKVKGLDGVVAQQDNYKRSGFKLAHRNLRFEGLAGGLAGKAYGIQPTADDLVKLSALDVAPSHRPTYFQYWLSQSQALVLQGQDSLILARPCQVGFKIGPFIAPDRLEAQHLLGAICAKLDPQAPVFIDVPETNAQALALVKSYNMAVQFETARMYQGVPTSMDHSRCFGITTLELG